MQPCLQPGCPTLVVRGRCRVHAARENFVVRRWYYTARWLRLRQQVLVDQAYACAECGQVQQLLEVDHIVKHEGNESLFWERRNLQALCPRCHIEKTKRGG